MNYDKNWGWGKPTGSSYPTPRHDKSDPQQRIEKKISKIESHISNILENQEKILEQQDEIMEQQKKIIKRLPRPRFIPPDCEHL